MRTLKISLSKQFLDKARQCYTYQHLASLTDNKITKQAIMQQMKRGELPYEVYDTIKEKIFEILEEEKQVAKFSTNE